MADDVLAFRDRALARRRRAIRQIPGRRLALAPIPPALVAAAGATASAGILLAEGDSWFDYPMHDVLRLLEDDHAYDVRSVAHRGDRLESMAYVPGQFEAFTRALEKVIREGRVPRAVLLSGGGNDIAGDEFQMLLNHALSEHPGLSEPVLTGVIDERLRDACVFALRAYTRLCERRTGRPLPILVHGYDYPVPDGRGVAGGWGPLPGPWLRPGFLMKGFEDLAVTTGMVQALIDRFNRMLAGVAAAAEFAHVRYVDLRGTLSNGRDYRRWWANELHPNGRGFARIAGRFADVLGALG
jgi:lysophospholipase L1-like esterase